MASLLTSLRSFDDNWQTKRPNISERTKFMFNNELLSDVKFVVPASHNQSERRKSRKCMIPEYLQEHLAASNVFSVLPQAQKFENKDLEEYGAGN